MQRILNFINGTYCEPASGTWLPNYNPALGEVYNEVADSDERDVQQAYEAAHRAFPQWSGMTQEQRSDIMLRVAQGIENAMETFVHAESNDQGKPCG